MSRSMMTGVTAILGGGGIGGGISGTNTLKTGGSDYANVADSATLQFSAAMTISAYVNIATTGGKQTIISKDTGGSDGYELYYDTVSGKFKGHIYIGVSKKEVESAVTPVAGTWYNVALWHDGANLKIYINGVQSGITPAIGSIDTNTSVFRIGASSTTIASNVFNGSIALVMGWNDDLTPSELTEIVTPKDPSLYTQQASMKVGLPLNGGSSNPATDTTGNSNNATLIGGADYTGVKLAIEQSAGGGPVEADYNMFRTNSSLDRYLELPNSVALQPTTSFTVTGWFNCQDVSDFQTIITKFRSAGANQRAIDIRLSSSKLQLIVSNDGSASAINISSTTTLSDSTLYSFAVVYDGSFGRIYLNGVEEITSAYAGTIHNSTAPWVFGDYSLAPTEDGYNGSFANISLSINKSLNATQIATLHNAGKIPYYETLPTSTTDDIDAFYELSSRDDSANDLVGSENATKFNGITSDGTLQTFAAYS